MRRHQKVTPPTNLAPGDSFTVNLDVTIKNDTASEILGDNGRIVTVYAVDYTVDLVLEPPTEEDTE
jgi:hypothetical protein